MKDWRKDWYKPVIASLFLSVIVGYFIVATLRTLIEISGFQGNLFDYEGTIAFIIETDPQNQLVAAILTGFFFFYMLKMMGIKDNKYEDASRFGVHGTSRWGKFYEYKKGKAFADKNNKYSTSNYEKAIKAENGIILGKIPETKELIIMPRTTSIDNRNVQVIGSSGSGKGQGFVYGNVINNREETMIVTDPKGEIYDATHQIKRDQGYKVFQIDFINFESNRYNPLDYVEDDQDAQEVAKIIAKNSAKDGKEDFFAVEGQRLLTALIIYCKHEFKNANIPEHVIGMYNKIVEDDNFLPNLLAEMSEEHPAYSILKSTGVAEGKTKSSIMATFSQQTGIFTLNKIAKMTKTSDFNFHDFQKEKSILYVKIRMDENPFTPLTATFFDQLISVFYKIADKNHSVLPIPSIFLLDEFANIGKIEKYGRVLATCRGLGMSMLTVIQDIAQLEGIYGKELARSIVSNHDTALFLRTKDTDTAKYFSNLAGETTVKISTKSNSQSGGGILSSKSSSSQSNSEQYVKRPLITEGELINIKGSQAYLFVSGYFPLSVEKAYQYEIYPNFLFNKERKPNYNQNRDKYISILQKMGVISIIPENNNQVEEELKDEIKEQTHDTVLNNLVEESNQIEVIEPVESETDYEAIANRLLEAEQSETNEQLEEQQIETEVSFDYEFDETELVTDEMFEDVNDGPKEESDYVVEDIQENDDLSELESILEGFNGDSQLIIEAEKSRQEILKNEMLLGIVTDDILGEVDEDFSFLEQEESK